MQPWYVVQIKSNAEVKAKRNLARQGVQIFAPFEHVTARRSGKLIETCQALFPGYLFVSFDPHSIQCRMINNTLGVSRIVSFIENRPAQVPMDLIASLKRRCDPTGRLLKSQPLKSGDIVRAAHGPFADIAGIVEHVAPNQRIFALFDILGKSTRVTVRSDDLRLIA